MSVLPRRRLLKEVRDFQNPPPGITAEPINGDLFHWHATISGPDNTPYAGGVFNLKINIPSDYPHKAPEVFFDPPLYHPSVDQETGEACLAMIQTEWAPTVLLTKVLTKLRELVEKPEPEHARAPEIAEEFLNNPTQFNKKVKEWIAKHK